jgi:hypothetical protein
VIVNDDLDATVETVDRVVEGRQSGGAPPSRADAERVATLIAELQRQIKEIA